MLTAKEARVLARALAAFGIDDDGDTDDEDHGWVAWAEYGPDGLRVRADDEDGEPTTATLTLADLFQADRMHPPGFDHAHGDYGFAASAFNAAVERQRAARS